MKVVAICNYLKMSFLDPEIAKQKTNRCEPCHVDRTKYSPTNRCPTLNFFKKNAIYPRILSSMP